MGLLARLYYRYRRFSKAIALFLMIAGPGIIVMVADNDAGGITTYIVTGSKFGFGLIWFVILLGPVAYVVQEMAVRLGAVTKRGHAEAIFDSFGPFWGWFSLSDLFLVDWLTLITEFIGMTAAMSIFHIPPWATVVCVSILMLIMVLQGRYWTWDILTTPSCLVDHSQWRHHIQINVMTSPPCTQKGIGSTKGMVRFRLREMKEAHAGWVCGLSSNTGI